MSNISAARNRKEREHVFLLRSIHMHKHSLGKLGKYDKFFIYRQGYKKHYVR